MKLTIRQLKKIISEAFEPRKIKVKDYSDYSDEQYLRRFIDLDHFERRPTGMLTHP